MTKGGTLAFGLGEGIKIPRSKNISLGTEQTPLYLRRLCSGTLKTVDRELAKFKSDLLGVQEVLWGKGVTERPEDYLYLFMKRK